MFYKLQEDYKLLEMFELFSRINVIYVVQMAYQELQSFVKKLESNKELVRVLEFVDPKLEITEVVDRMSKSGNGGKALLFENTGTDFPVLINMMGSEKRICMALGVDTLTDFGEQIEALFKTLSMPRPGILDKLKVFPLLRDIASWMPKRVPGRGACQQVIMEKPDLTKLPILQCWPHDGGRFVTFPMVVTRDPYTGIRNVGMYRMQVFDSTTTGMHWHKHKTGARHYNEYKKRGERMPVSVALGGDPALTFSATAPLPDNIDEFMLAGFLRKKRVEMVKCLTNDLEVPANADFVIEGYVDPQEDLAWEGPFGDHTGFYSLADWYPRFHVTCITHRKNAIYPATIVGVPPMEDAWIAKATERIFLAPIKMTILPEMKDMDMPFVGVAHNLVLAKLEKTYAGQGLKAMNALWGAGQMMFNKILVALDGDINIHDYLAVVQMMSRKINPNIDIYIGKGPLDVLDHASSKFAFGGKLFLDATTKTDEEQGSSSVYHQAVDSSKIKEVFYAVHDVNNSLLKIDVSAVIISIDKNKTNSVHSFINDLLDSGLCRVKCLIVVDHNVEVQDIQTTMWVAMNNIDASRDVRIHEQWNCLQVDATRKMKRDNHFERNWPNVVVSSPGTIQSIDAKWTCLGLGKFIQSPSLKFQGMLWKGNAEVDQ